MPTIANTTAASGTTGTTSGSQPAKELGKDDFLSLLVTQMKYQDPLNPMGNEQFIAQMTQFSLLEQMTNLTAEQTRTRADALVGRTVSYTTPLGEAASGLVERVDYVDGKPSLTVAGVSGIDPTAITSVA